MKMMTLILSGFWQSVQSADFYTLRLINRRWSNAVFDAILPWTRDAILWIPLYVFLIIFALINFGKKGFYWILGFIATVGICDQVSSSFLKRVVARPRPCSNPDVSPYIELRVYHCSGGYSFTSSHAANHFGMAMFIFATLHHYIGPKTAFIFLWAFVISYAQVYVGVHYPLDIIGGAIVGLACGKLTASVFNKYIGLEKKLA